MNKCPFFDKQRGICVKKKIKPHGKKEFCSYKGEDYKKCRDYQQYKEHGGLL